jgi:hypothetical protein
MFRSLGPSVLRRLLVLAGLGLVAVSTTAAASEPCGTGMYPFPYTDVSSVGDPFCPGIMEAYVTGVSKGTTMTTFSPNETVTRVQMTTFLQRSLDQGLSRANKRAALKQWWTPQSTKSMQTIGGGGTYLCATDGENIWTTNGGEVLQVQASTGTILRTWTGSAGSFGAVVAAGKVFVTGAEDPGQLYVVDPTQPPGALTSVAVLGTEPQDITFDGTNLWTANLGGSVSIIDPQSYAVTTVSTGFSNLAGVLYDGAHIWVTDYGASALFQLNASGGIAQSVAVGIEPAFATFDGTNIWVPNFSSNSITVVEASSGRVVATISSDGTNKLDGPVAASFDGERILVSNVSGNSLTLFKAADLSFISNVATGSPSAPYGTCSDGINFWIPLLLAGNLLRF